MSGITIVAIDEKEGKHIIHLLEEILDRVKRIPGKAADVRFTLGAVKTQQEK